MSSKTTLPKAVKTTANDKNSEAKKLKLMHDFYDVEIDRSTGKLKEIQFDRLRLCNKLKQLGFFRYDLPDGAYQYVRISNARLQIVQQYYIIDTFEDYINDLPNLQHEFIIDENKVFVTVNAKMIMQKMYKSIKTYFSPEYLQRLRPDKEIVIQEDTEREKFIFYKNCYVEVSKQGIFSKEYKHLKNFIFDGSVLSREFQYTESVGDFEKFVANITGRDTQRKLSLMSLIGYMLHGFFECKRQMLVLTDVNDDGEGEANGGTGKSLIAKGCGKMLNGTKDDTRYVELDGKILDPANSKKYMNANIDTRLVHINDCQKYFPIDRLYNDITEGITVHKHHAAPYVVPVKLIISTNQTLKIDGTSSKRRVIFFELHNYYSDIFDPEMDFKKRFFESSWTGDDWNEFDSFMIRCIKLYLEKNILRAAEINYTERALKEHTNSDFVYWFEEQLKVNDVANMVQNNGEYQFKKQELFEHFITRYPDFNNPKFKRAKFTDWVVTYCNKKNIKMLQKRSTEDLFVFVR